MGDVKEFLAYFKEYYGPGGRRQDLLPDGYTDDQVIAGIVARGEKFDGDTIDRELIRDMIINHLV